jgi:hypothetical protein
MNMMLFLVLMIAGPGKPDSATSKRSWVGDYSAGYLMFSNGWKAGFFADFSSRDRLKHPDSHPGEYTLIENDGSPMAGNIFSMRWGGMQRIAGSRPLFLSTMNERSVFWAAGGRYTSHRGEIPNVFYNSSAWPPTNNPLDTIRWRRYEAEIILAGIRFGKEKNMHFRVLPVVEVYAGAGVGGAVMALKTIEKFREDHPDFREWYAEPFKQAPEKKPEVPQTAMSIIEDPYLVWRKPTSYGPVFQLSGSVRAGVSLRLIKNRTNQVGVWAFGEALISGDANSAQRGGFFMTDQRMLRFGIRIMK